MDEKYIKLIAAKLGIRDIQVKNTAFLFSQGATVPFISRYRKEQTGTLNEVQVSQIKEELKKYEELEKRKTAILESIEGQGKLTDELKKKIDEVLSECYHKGLTYNLDTGAIQFSDLRFETPDQINTVIDNLFALGLFESDIDYSGYTVEEPAEDDDSEENDEKAKYPVVVSSITMYLKGEAE